MTSLCVKGDRQVERIIAGLWENMHVRKKPEEGLLLPGNIDARALGQL